MDFSGQRAGYRGAAIRCPGCAEPMSTESVSGTDVDVCAACGGVWTDWFDGEVREIASKIVEQNVVGRPRAPDAVRNEARAIGACPRCSRHLASERYVIRTVVPTTRGPKRTETPTGAEVLRCEDCAGAFLSRTSVEVLAALPPEREEPAPPPPAPKAAPTPTGALGRIAAVVRGLLGKGRT